MNDSERQIAQALQLANAGRGAEAEAALRAIIEANPQQHEALNSLAAILHQRRATAEAVGLLQQAVRLAPTVPHYRSNLGKLLEAVGQEDMAISVYRECLALAPNEVSAIQNLTRLLVQRDQTEEALRLLEHGLAVYPQSADLWGNLGFARLLLKEWSEAARCFREATRLAPEVAGHRSNLGASLRRMKEYDAAIASYHQALAINPNDADVLNNLGNVLNDIGRLEEAEVVLQKALRLRPRFTNALYNLAHIRRMEGRFLEAIAFYDYVIAQQPNYADALLNRSLMHLLFCEWEPGWELYESRWKTVARNVYPAPPWQREPLAGKTILLWSEQGLGDTLQFVRYAPLLKEMGARVLLHCPPHLIPILRTAAGIDELIPMDLKPPAMDYELPLLSLPHRFRTELKTIPNRVPYLAADPARRAKWKQILNAIPGFRIGIAWQGNPDYTGDKNRSFPLRNFAPLAEIPGVQLISLQFGPGLDQLRDPQLGFQVHELPPRDADGAFLDTAAILQELDLVISSDTSLVHLAGALGVRTGVILGVSPNWRWHFGFEINPWYPTMRNYWQTTYGDWSEPFQRVTRDVRGLVQLTQRSSAGRT